MSQTFSQKYAIIQLLEYVPVGAIFSSNQWPLHVTVADTFAVDWDASTMTQNLNQLLSDYQDVSSVAGVSSILGTDKKVRVRLLQKTDSLVGLHHDVVRLLKLGGWRPNDPQFAGDGFLPHSTD